MTVPHSGAGRAAGDEGAVLLLLSLFMTALLAMTAVVVDLSALRQDVRAERAAADFAVSTGADELVPGLDPRASVACQRAWDTFAANSADATPVVTAPVCATFAGTCGTSTPARSTEAVAGRYRVTITHPVPDGHPLMTGRGGPAQPVVPAIDGRPCERVGMRIVASRDFHFGTVLGLGSGTTNVHAVARASLSSSQELIAALLLLDRTGCNTLRAEGNGTVIVQASPVSAGVNSPGVVVVDSDGSDCSYTVDAAGTSSRIRAEDAVDAPGHILLYGMQQWAYECHAPACDPADVFGDSSVSRIWPQPEASLSRVGRAPVDWRYNCKSTYTLAPPWSGLVPPCPTASAPHIDDLVASNQLGPGVAPAGFATYAGSCDIGASASPITLTGDWYIPCPTFTTRTSFTVDGNAVFQGPVAVTSANGSLTIGDGVDPAVLYLRSGGITKDANGSMRLRNTMVYLHNGGIAFSGGAGAMEWIAPSSGPFEDLALWSESTQSHSLGGQAGNALVGILFTPRTGYSGSPAFQVRGNSGQFQTQAQFITYRLLVTGDGQVLIRPTPDTAIAIEFNQGSGLIR